MRRILSHRRWVLLVAVLSLVIAACSSETEGTTTTGDSGQETTTTADSGEVTTTTSGDETTTTAPEPSGMSVGMGNLPPSGVPWTGAGSPGQYIWGQVFDALTFIAPDGSVAPGLATEWEAIDDTTWEFTLREDVTFSDGTPFNADTVVGTFDIILSEEGRSTYSASVTNYDYVTEVEAVDDMTVQITTDSPQVLTPNALSIAYIVPPDHFNEVGAEAFATAPVGTGPYTAIEWSDQSVVLESWDGSWRGTPTVESVEFLNLNEPAARLQALQSGQVQIAQSISPDQIEPLQSDGFTIFSGSRGSVLSLALINVDGGPLESTEVRRALNMAVDKQAIVDQLLQGLAAPGQWAIEGIGGYEQSPGPIEYDPEQAQQLLADAGYPDGFDMLAEITVGAFPADADIYEATQGYLAEVGVNVEMRQIDFGGEWLPKFLGSDGADWEGEAFGLSWNAAPLMNAIRPFNFYSCGWINEFFCDPDAEELVNQVNATFDEAEREQAMEELLTMTKENPPALWLSETVELWGLDPSVQGFSVDNFNILFEEVTLSG